MYNDTQQIRHLSCVVLFNIAFLMSCQESPMLNVVAPQHRPYGESYVDELPLHLFFRDTSDDEEEESKKFCENGTRFSASSTAHRRGNHPLTRTTFTPSPCWAGTTLSPYNQYLERIIRRCHLPDGSTSPKYKLLHFLQPSSHIWTCINFQIFGHNSNKVNTNKFLNFINNYCKFSPDSKLNTKSRVWALPLESFFIQFTAVAYDRTKIN